MAEESSKACPPAIFCVSTVGRDFNKNSGHYTQQTRDEIKNMYWQCNRIGAKSGTMTACRKLSTSLANSPLLSTKHTPFTSDTEYSIEDTLPVPYTTRSRTSHEFPQACTTKYAYLIARDWLFVLNILICQAFAIVLRNRSMKRLYITQQEEFDNNVAITKSDSDREQFSLTSLALRAI